MAKPFSELSRILGERTDEFLRGVDILTRDAASAAGRTAAATTRVDTGKARSNWRASTTAPVAGVIPPYAAGNKLGITETGNLNGAVAQQRSVIQGWRSSKEQILFISNNVDYISTLNFGGPAVAPGNMLALARQAWRNTITTPRKILID